MIADQINDSRTGDSAAGALAAPPDRPATRSECKGIGGWIVTGLERGDSLRAIFRHVASQVHARWRVEIAPASVRETTARGRLHFMTVAITNPRQDAASPMASLNAARGHPRPTCAPAAPTCRMATHLPSLSFGGCVKPRAPRHGSPALRGFFLDDQRRLAAQPVE